MALSVGVVGLGKMGVLHSAILNSLPQSKVAAVCERNRFLRSVGRSLLPRAIRIYSEVETMLADEAVDAVFVTTPIHTHADILMDILKSNSRMNLFVEKPLAHSREEAGVLCETVRNSECVNMVGFQKRYSLIFQKAKSIIQTGQIGDLLSLKAHSFSSDVLREGGGWRFQKGKGGALLDLGPHVLDLLLWYFGDPEPTAAVKTRFYSHEVDDYVHTAISFDSGLKGYLNVSWSIPDFRLPEIAIEVRGEQGTLTVTDDYVRLRLNDADQQTWYRQSFETSIPILMADPEFTREDEAFLGAIERIRPAAPSFCEAAKINGVIDCINAIAKQGSK